MDMLIYRDGNGYSVEHFGAVGAQVRALFGTCLLPTAYTSGTRPRAVQEALQRLNPDCEVLLHPDLLDEEREAGECP